MLTRSVAQAAACVSKPARPVPYVWWMVWPKSSRACAGSAKFAFPRARTDYSGDARTDIGQCACADPKPDSAGRTSAQTWRRAALVGRDDGLHSAGGGALGSRALGEPGAPGDCPLSSHERLQSQELRARSRSARTPPAGTLVAGGHGRCGN
jgi:hypothetical protein